MSLGVQLVGHGSVGHGGVQEVLIVLRGDGHVQSVVGAGGLVIAVHVLAEHVARVIGGADTGVDVHAVQSVAQHAQGQVGLHVGVLADGTAVAVGDGGHGVGVGVIAEGGHALSLGPAVEHGHAHAVVVGDHNVDLIAEGGGPGGDGVAGGGGVPSGAGGVLHLLRGQLTDGVGGAAHINGAILHDGGGAVGVGAHGVGIDGAVGINAGAQSGADAAGTGNGVVVADVADGQDVADDAVAVAVDGVNVVGDVLQDHLALQLGALVGVEAHVVGVVVEGQGVHVQLAGGAVGGLAVEPDQGLVLVGDLGGRGGTGVRAGSGTGTGGSSAIAAGSQAQGHSGGQGQCKSFFHSNSPFLMF